MEFWGVEVKSGKPLAVTNDLGKMLHLSQATMGESKEENTDESVRIYVTVDGQKFALGILSSQNNPQLLFDLVLEKDFELSHNWKNGSVFFLGYKTGGGEYFLLGFTSDEELDSEDEGAFSFLKGNGKIEAKDKPIQPAVAKADTKVEPSNKPKSKAGSTKVEAEPKKDDEDDSSDDEDYTDEDEEMISADEDYGTDGDDSGDDNDDDDDEDDDDDDEDDDGDESEDDEDEDTPKADLSKKRSNESAAKTSVPATKKAKFATPQKTEGKKGGHTATPHPKMQSGKTPASGNKKDQINKSGGSQFSCNSCKKTFNSDGALQSHTKAKHGAK